MAERTFADWVEPVAAALADGRRQVLDFARSAPAELWDRPSEAGGWTCKDVLGHLAGGNDRALQTVLRSVTSREPLDAALLQMDTDAENKQGVDERRDWTIEKVITVLEEDGQHVQDLLSKLTDDDKDLRQDGFPMSLGEFLKIVEEEHHDLLHLNQIKSALEARA